MSVDRTTQPLLRDRSGRGIRGAFTLIELLIVVVILGILAALLIPRITVASNVARSTVLKDDLRYLRTQIQVYMAQHEGRVPGTKPDGSVGDGNLFIRQLITFTDELGNPSDTVTATHCLGPYLVNMPENPITGKRGVLVIRSGESSTVPAPSPSLGDGNIGWIFDISEARLMANVEGTDAEGVPYSSY